MPIEVLLLRKPYILQAKATGMAPMVAILVEDCNLQRVSGILSIPTTPAKVKNIPIIISAIKNMDAELKSMFIELIKELSSLYLKNLAPHEKSNMSDFKKPFISHLSSK